MEFRFNVGTGRYRHFMVTADNEERAKERFDAESKRWPSATYGFKLKDVTSIREIKQEDAELD